MPFEDLDVGVLFPVPFITVKLKDSEELNRALLAEIAKRRRDEPGIDRSNRYGWHSEPDLFARTEPAHKKLISAIDGIVAAATKRLLPGLPGGLKVRHEGWINVNPTHAMNAPHDHPGAFWSGCYYIHVPPPDDPEDQLSGSIEFIDPRGALGSSAKIETPFTRSKCTVKPVPGTCLLWPSFLKHWVHPNNSSQERVSVAFNSWYSRSAASRLTP